MSALRRVSAAYDAFDRQFGTAILVAAAAVISAIALGAQIYSRYTEVPGSASDAGVVVAVNDLTTTSTTLYPIAANSAAIMPIDSTRAQSVVETTTSRFLVDTIWTGVAGEQLTLRRMKSGDYFLCGRRTDCAEVVQPDRR